jgi:mgtE-like transporter
MVTMATVNGVKERSVVWRIYREAMPVLLLTALAELMAGGLLQNIEVFYAILPGLVVLVPGLMQLRGNISTSLAQRLGSATHLGLISWKQGFNQPLRSNVKASLILVTVMSFLLGFGAWGATQLVAFTTFLSSGVVLTSPMTLPRFVTVSMVTALLASLVQVTTTVLVALIAHARGLDPDNITIPVVATVGDVLTVACLLAAINLALMLPF